MGSTVFPQPSSGKTRYLTTLTSGTSWTVPSGVTYVNVTLRGGGGGGGASSSAASVSANQGHGGQIVSSTLSTTPGASISYSIGAGGSPAQLTGRTGSPGGTTTFTGATSASGGNGGNGYVESTGTVGTASLSATNGGLGGIGGGGTTNPGATGGAGSIDIEYWL